MRSRITRSDRGLTVTRAILLVAAVGLIGVLAYRQIDRLVGTAPVAVWVLATDLGAGKTVTAAQLKQVRMAPPAGALVNRSDIEGRTLMLPKAKGQPFYVRDLAPRPPVDPLADTVPSGRLLATVRVDAMDLPVSELRAGDRLDVMQAGADGVVRLVAHDAYVMGLLESKSTKASKAGSGVIMGVDISVPDSRPSTSGHSSLVLALLPQDVFPLAAAEGSGRTMKIVLHSQGEIRSGKLLSVVPPAPRPSSRGSAADAASVEVLTGARRETVHFTKVSGGTDATSTPGMSPVPGGGHVNGSVKLLASLK